jgi:hypothetical protein
MPILPPITVNPLQYTAQDVCNDAAIEVGIIAPGEVLDGDTGNWIFRKLNYLIDEWQAEAGKVYSYQYTLFTLVAGLSPHTIGPEASATFLTDNVPRPVRLESAALILNVSPTQVDLPMNIRDHDWWAMNQVKQIQTNVPTDVFYDPTSPNGSLFFWPVPNSQAQVRLQFWNTVNQYTAITDPLGGLAGPGTLPQAYRAALMYTLAERLLPGSRLGAPPELAGMAVKARAALFGNNAKSPRLATRDSGMPQAGKSGTRADFNWATGGYPGGPPQ